MKEMDIKPNYSELSRKYDLDRHTIKKYYDNDGVKIKDRKRKHSKYDKYLDEIKEIMQNTAVSIVALYHYLDHKYPDDNLNYNGLKAYTISKGITRKGISTIPHVRYETKPGEQLQVVWKEDLKMTSKNGEVFEFNLYGATLGYSRLHTFVYSKTRTTEDFLRCTIDVLNSIGGKTATIKTDNMAAVVSITNGYKKKHNIIKQFEKDLDVKIRLCEVRTPETKGKVESSNRFMSWLEPYNYKFEDETELIEIIKIINKQINEQINQTTSIPPIKLFNKEKEYLLPLPSKVLLESYISNVTTQIVPATLLVTYNGKGYSVSKRYIGKRVKICPISDKLYIYFNTDLISFHDMSSNKFNYKKEHYAEALKTRIKNDDVDIDKISEENLKLLERVGKYE